MKEEKEEEENLLSEVVSNILGETNSEIKGREQVRQIFLPYEIAIATFTVLKEGPSSIIFIIRSIAAS